MSKNNRKKVYKKQENPCGNSAFGRLMISIIILGIVILIFINYGLPLLKQEVSHVAAKKTVDVITEHADKIAQDNPEVAQVLESLSEEDKETVTEIISEHMDTETVTEVMEYVEEGNKEALVEYATENLSPEEIEELIKIYGKYAPEYMNGSN